MNTLNFTNFKSVKKMGKVFPAHPETTAFETTTTTPRHMFRTRVVSFSVGFASASAIGLYKLNRDIEKSTQIVLNHVNDAEKRLKGVEEEIAKMKSAAATTT